MPRLWSWAAGAWLAAVYLAFGATWTFVAWAAGAPGWVAAVGLPLMIGVTVLVVGFYRAKGRAEVGRGPVLIWSPSTGVLSFPRESLRVPRERIVAFELFGHWRRLPDALVRTRGLDVVVRDDESRTTTRRTIAADATRLARLGQELSRRTAVPLERIHR